MIWFFERSTQVLELETRYDNATSEYVLELRAPGSSPQVERFSDAVRFRTRLLAVERSLEGQHWKRHGDPVVLPDGWPNRTPVQ